MPQELARRDMAIDERPFQRFEFVVNMVRYHAVWLWRQSHEYGRRQVAGSSNSRANAPL